MLTCPNHDHDLFGPKRLEEDARELAEIAESLIATRFTDLLADDDAVLAAWAAEDDAGTCADVLALVREQRGPRYAELAQAFADAMVQRCRDRLWKQAGTKIAPQEPQAQLVRAARYVLIPNDRLGFVPNGAMAALREAEHNFRWIPS